MAPELRNEGAVAECDVDQTTTSFGRQAKHAERTPAMTGPLVEAPTLDTLFHRVPFRTSLLPGDPLLSELSTALCQSCAESATNARRNRARLSNLGGDTSADRGWPVSVDFDLLASLPYSQKNGTLYCQGWTGSLRQSGLGRRRDVAKAKGDAVTTGALVDLVVARCHDEVFQPPPTTCAFARCCSMAAS